MLVWLIDFIQEVFLNGFMWLFWFLPLAMWTLIWQGIALWQSARNNQIYWFMFNLFLGYAGVLPIIYLLFFKKYKTDYSKNL